MNLQLCAYCGIVCDTVDHVVPRHLLERAEEAQIDLSKIMRFRHWEVPACKECNCGLSGQIFPTMALRRADAHKRIKKKYAHFLRIPHWEDYEIAKLGPRAQEDLRKAIEIRDWVKQRLAWRGGSTDIDINAIYGLYRKAGSK